MQAAPPPKERSVAKRTGVNLGTFYSPRAIESSPVFAQEEPTLAAIAKDVEMIHVALVKLKSPQDLDDTTLSGIGRTLSSLTRLGMSCCIVLDTGITATEPNWRHKMLRQSERVADAVDRHAGRGSRRIEDILSITPDGIKVQWRKLLVNPLRLHHPVILNAVAYTEATQTATPVDADEVMITLTKELAGLGHQPDPDADPHKTAETIRTQQKEVSLDRLIVLDPLGGIPKIQSLGGAHVFINMEQEYNDLKQELTGAAPSVDTKPAVGEKIEVTASITPDVMARHLKNLELTRDTLAFLPPTSTALITTPQEAANSARVGAGIAPGSSVATRRQRNPLIHNLLTDKPAHSSSLPLGRLGATPGQSNLHPVDFAIAPSIVPSTMVKRGMPLSVFPNPRIQKWLPPSPTSPRINLSDPSIDLARLVHLIEDSFGRPLDVEHYLARVHDRIAGLIIAGEYEGGAILTWELPPSVPDDGSPESQARMVPYLDKFAVLRRSQGSGGVADAVFNAMVRSCFPDGVCWRSRRDNPVNKWYFERSRGTWKVPGSNWTMFWTTEGLLEGGPLGEQRFKDYEEVCRSVLPSWADGKVAD